MLSVITLHIATAISNLPCTFPSIIPFNPAPWVAAGIREIMQAKLWYGAFPTVGTCEKNTAITPGAGGGRGGGGGAAVLQAGLGPRPAARALWIVLPAPKGRALSPHSSLLERSLRSQDQPGLGTLATMLQGGA